MSHDYFTGLVDHDQERNELGWEMFSTTFGMDVEAAFIVAEHELPALLAYARDWDAYAGAIATWGMDEAEAAELDELEPIETCGDCGVSLPISEMIEGCPACHAEHLEYERQQLERVLYVPEAVDDPRVARAMDRALYMKAGGASARQVGRHWFVASRSSSAVYRVTEHSCSCAAGERNVPCWHVALVTIQCELAA